MFIPTVFQLHGFHLAFTTGGKLVKLIDGLHVMLLNIYLRSYTSTKVIHLYFLEFHKGKPSSKILGRFEASISLIRMFEFRDNKANVSHFLDDYKINACVNLNVFLQETF